MSLYTAPKTQEVVYPDSDGQPMADNTLQYRWIELLKGNLEILFANDPNVFVAADLLWYSVQGRPGTRIAPDVLVAFGRPKGDRGSYQQWNENGIAPQVVFEVLSPGNRVPTRREGCGEMTQKGLFYDRYGVQEYYIYDPARFEFDVLVRQEDVLTPVAVTTEWVSSLLGVRFVPHDNADLEIFYPDGHPFVSMTELDQLRQQERQRAEAAEERAAKLAAKLQALGIAPDA
jgi:Uma2 family endonuclease